MRTNIEELSKELLAKKKTGVQVGRYSPCFE
jgi:hypothetical protein